MYHSITFIALSGDSKNTWDDWKLVPSTRPVINPPEQKKKYIDIPGADSAIDLSESLTGYPVYNDRQGSLEFVVINDFKDWVDAYSDIMDFLHGRKVMLILENDPKHYYIGRTTINQWKSEQKRSSIIIDYQLEPYKLAISDSTGDAIQKVFCSDISIDSTSGTVVKNFYGSLIGRKPVCPQFVITTSDNNGMDIRCENDELGLDIFSHFTDGEHINPNFIFSGLSPENNVKLSITGHGSLSIIFRSGRL